MDLVQQVIDRRYTPTSVTGTKMYFCDCETDQHQSKYIGIDPISDVMVMTAALWAFSTEHHGERLQHITESWELANTTVAFPQDQYE